MENKHWEYKIGGNLHSIIPALIVLAVFGCVSIWLYSSNNGAFVFTLALTALALLLTAYSIYRFLFVKILLGEDGFYHQTKPGDGKYYKYTDITEAWESSGKNQNGTTAYYCSFKTANGQVIKFAFLPLEADEVDYFLTNINGKYSDINGEDIHE
ncbi:MAG TPA: hypothetical protein VFD52_06645 [Clostridia bacterium]|nr:hypothetical protein [Clostridia bacterium]